MEVNNLDLLPELSQIKMTLPDELPPPVHRDRIPPELLRSSTIENLISQNEELMTRLKVTLRRLALLEDENQRLNSENQKENMRASTVSEQVLVLKEKDQIWRNKIDDLEKVKSQLQERLITLENMYAMSQSQVERYTKYHDKIRTQVKPFVQELKKYSKSLEAKLQTVQSENDKKEAQISDLRHQIIEVSKNSKFQIELLEKKNWQTSEHYETLIQQLTKECEELKLTNAELTQKTEKMKDLEERADHYENQNVELRRRIETMAENHQYALEAAEEKVRVRSTEYSKLAVEHQDVVQKVLEELETRKNLEKQVYDLRHQLDSLRYMWTAKNEENEKLRQSLQALEKLNLDLSSKLQEIRSEGS